MNISVFSISLTVKDLAASTAFFEKNMLSFNPGWDQNAENVGEFTDVRELQKQLEASEITLVSGVDDLTEGPASIVLTDPDGNPVLINHHACRSWCDRSGCRPWAA
jgi:catechol 2,3-dioxygenase-like lactoylglutathione lyase family enzyme